MHRSIPKPRTSRGALVIDPEILKLYTRVLDDVSQEAMRRLEAAGKGPQDDTDEENGPAKVAG